MKRAVVIGAGAAGLAALRSLSKRPDSLTFVAYECSDRVGGTWIHNDKYKPTSMYDNLRTNLPKEVMAYPDLPFPSSITESYVGHKEVLGYLQEYASHFELEKYIRFQHTVLQVDLVNTEPERWNVTVRDNSNNSVSSEIFDSVFVCNGHYAIPLVPDIRGSDTFAGEIIHSHHYRSPTIYKDKTVFVLGAGPSGIDIAIDMAPQATKVYLGHNKARFVSPLLPNVQEVFGIDSINGSEIILNDGSTINADVVMLATGYRYDFPFLTERCQPVIRNECFKSIYRMLVSIDHPSMFFIGLNKQIVPFPQFFIQTEYAVALIIGAAPTPSKQEMQEEFDSLYKELVVDCGRREKDFHFIGNYQWDYCRQLSDISRTDTPLKSVSAELYQYSAKIRKADVTTYKQSVVRMTEDGNDFVVLREPLG